MPVPDAGLTTSQLAARTGVAAGTLRMWEERHRFPLPVRTTSGHRRYQESAVSAVREVLRLRGQGLSLSAATARVRAASPPANPSIFAALRERRPELTPTLLAKPVVLALTRAIEDEYCSQGASGLLIGSFQRERFYRQTQRRWRELARTSERAVALADFPRLRHGPGEVAEVPVARDHPLAREWTLLVSSDSGRAVLAAWERPSSTPPIDSQRRFEVLWSFDPEVVYAATAIAAELVALASDGMIELSGDRPEPPAASGPELRSAGALSQRVLTYLCGEPVAYSRYS
jgi:DICT domain-containing protein/predicted DNA-binding transcriptional regulator AlpA